VGNPVPGSVVSHTAASNGTRRRSRVEASAKTAAGSSARWTRSTSSFRRRRISVGMVTGTASMVGRYRAARNPSDGGRPRRVGAGQNPAIEGLAPTPPSDTLGRRS
jgi:hypothetical protein